MSDLSSSSHKKKAIVLGGTHPHIQLLKNLSRRGYETILVDYYENPCAKPYADIHIQESTLNRDLVLEIAKKENASLVISACIDQANLIACSVAEELGLPHPYNTDIARVVTNKLLMKTFMVQNGVPTSPFVSVRAPFESADLSLRYPLIVKPSDSNSSKGVRKIESPSQLSSAVQVAISLSRAKEAIIEEFAAGREIGMDFFVRDQDPVLLISKERRKIPACLDAAQQIYGCYWPASLTSKEIEAGVKVAKSIADALKLRNCPLMIQAILNDNGFRVIEFAARFGGGESVSIIKKATGIDITELSIMSYNDEPMDEVPKSPRLIYAETFIYSKPCEFGSLQISTSISSEKLVDVVHQYKTRGMRIGAELSSNNRIGSVIVSAFTKPELISKTKRALDGIRVHDIAGKDCFRKELYSYEGQLVV